MASHNLAHIVIDDLDIIGYSVAAEETVIGMPQLDVCFDIGKAPDQVISINNVLLTHGHIDHAAGLGYYLSHRNFSGQKPGTILMPPNLLGPVRQIMEAWAKIDGSRFGAELVGVKAGDEYKIKPNLIARVFPTKHTAGSVGYTIIEKRKKIKPEYAKLTGPQIVELKKQKITIDNPVEIPIVTYFGDTKYVDFSQLDYVAKSKILIVECTFFDDEHLDRANAGKHIYVDEFVKLVEKMENQHIIISHLTQRTGIYQAKKILKQKLGAEHLKKTIFLMDKKYRTGK